jgi:hypothetical protein
VTGYTGYDDLSEQSEIEKTANPAAFPSHKERNYLSRSDCFPLPAPAQEAQHCATASEKRECGWKRSRRCRPCAGIINDKNHTLYEIAKGIFALIAAAAVV